MSAWLVSKEHIDALVTAAIALDVIGAPQATSAGEELWQENVESLRYRYEDRAEEYWDLPKPGAYRFAPYPIEDLFVIFKNAGCYHYQSCEHPEFEDSTAAVLTEKLQQAVLAKLGLTSEQAYGDARYNSAPWGIDKEPVG